MPRLSLKMEPELRLNMKTLALISALLAVLGSVYAGVRYSVYFVGRVDNAVQKIEFNAHLQEEIRQHTIQDSVLSSVIKRQSERDYAARELTCYVYKNPRPFCNEFVRQAGRPR